MFNVSESFNIYIDMKAKFNSVLEKIIDIFDIYVFEALLIFLLK